MPTNPVFSSISLVIERRGSGMVPSARAEVLQLLSMARELQSRFELVERTAVLLDQMLDGSAGLHEAINNTYEAHAFATLRIQLFRILTVDLCASVLDDTKGSLSLTKMYGQLKPGSRAVNLLRTY